MKMSYLWSLVVFLVVAPFSLRACQVPVFRYALERWEADHYQVHVLHRGGLAPSEQQLVEQLRAAATADEMPVNFEVELIDLDHPPEGYPLDEEMDQFDAPLIRVHYPYSSRMLQPAWEGALSLEHVNGIISSPSRVEISQRILEGESAVWVLIQSGDALKDAKAEATLRQELKLAAETLQLPEGYEADEQFNVEVDIEMQIAFSLLVLDRKDAAEAFFLSSLLNSEHEQMPADEPIVVPIYGQGRTFWVLAGAGIHAENIMESCRFITGPCGCEVKRDNPGTDLIFQMNWDERVLGSAIPENVLPAILPAPGLPEDYQGVAAETLAVAADSVAGSQPVALVAEERSGGIPIALKVLVALICMVLGVGVVQLRRQRKSGK